MEIDLLSCGEISRHHKMHVERGNGEIRQACYWPRLHSSQLRILTARSVCPHLFHIRPPAWSNISTVASSPRDMVWYVPAEVGGALWGRKAVSICRGQDTPEDRGGGCVLPSSRETSSLLSTTVSKAGHGSCCSNFWLSMCARFCVLFVANHTGERLNPVTVVVPGRTQQHHCYSQGPDPLL